MDKAGEAKMLVDTKTLVEVNGHLYVLLRKKVLEQVGSVSLLGKAAGEVSAGHWSEETLQTLRLQGEISRRAWKDNLGLFKRRS